MSLTTQDLDQITTIVTDVVTGAVSGLATKDELWTVKTELRDDISGLDNKLDREISGLNNKLDHEILGLNNKLDQVKTMISEDYFAEAMRVNRIDRRLTKLQREFSQHIATNE